MGNLREQEVHSAALLGLGFIPGEVHYAAKGSGVPYGFFRDARKVTTSRLHTTIKDAYSAVGRSNGNNNVIVLSPDSHTQSIALTFDKNMTHLVGDYPAALMNQRSRIGHDANFDALLTLSGYGNLLQSLYLMHGRGSATNLHALEITGASNTVKNCHIGGPMHATEAGTAGYSALELTGALECYFKDSVFGIDTIARSAANSILRLGAGASRNIFEDCLFLSMASAGTPYFIEVLASVTFGWTLFKNCQFINFSSNWASPLTVGILNSSPSYSHRLAFDSKCSFYGVTDVIDLAGETSVMFGTVPYTASALFNGLVVNPDVS